MVKVDSVEIIIVLACKLSVIACVYIFVLVFRTELLSEFLVRMSIKELFSVGSVQYNVTVTNTGKMAGATSVLAYVTSNVSMAG